MWCDNGTEEPALDTTFPEGLKKYVNWFAWEPFVKLENPYRLPNTWLEKIYLRRNVAACEKWLNVKDRIYWYAVDCAADDKAGKPKLPDPENYTEEGLPLAISEAYDLGVQAERLRATRGAQREHIYDAIREFEEFMQRSGRALPY